MSARKKILLVDDSPTVLLMERLLLQDLPYTLLTASNGQEALRLARSERPELILMDVLMPGMDGFEVCLRLRAEEATRATPIILVTTRGGAEHVQRGYECGCNDYVTKPFDARELKAKVDSYLSP